MHALASPGRLKEFQRSSCSVAMPELSVVGSSASGERATSSTTDCVTTHQSRAQQNSLMKDCRPANMLKVSDTLSLRRLEQLENELASLNHAQRRLPINDDDVASNDRSAPSVSRYMPVTDRKSGFDGGLDNVVESVRSDRDLYMADRVSDALNLPNWISSSFGDRTAVQRRQMCGGSVRNRSSSVASTYLQSHPPSSSTAGDLMSRYADSKFYGGACSSRGLGSAELSERTSTDADEFDDCRLMSAALISTPTKREPVSYSPDVVDERLFSPVNSVNMQKPTEKLEEEFLVNSPNGEDCSLRSKRAGGDLTIAHLLSPSSATHLRDTCDMTGDGVKPAFWMTDYKQPKRCKKGNCTFQTVSKIEFWDHLSVHFSDDKLFRCDRCPFRTPLKHHMTSHRMNHDDDKPFSCDLCSYRAVSQSMVNSHKKSHSSVRPYICEYPGCHYATKFVNQLTKHREKQHPGFVPSSDGCVRRRRQSESVPPASVQTHRRCYLEDRVAGIPPPVLPQTAAVVRPPSLADEVAGRNTAAMLPWSMNPCGWSPFNFLQRMAAAAAVSGLPLCPQSPLSLSARRSVDVKPFQPPLPPTLPLSQASEGVSERGLFTTPQKPASALDGRDDALSRSTQLITAGSDMESRGTSFLTRLAAAAADVTNKSNLASDDHTTFGASASEPVPPRSSGNDSVAVAASSNRASPRSDVVDGTDHHQALSGLEASSCPTPAGRNGLVIDVNNHPLDLTSRTNSSSTSLNYPGDNSNPADMNTTSVTDVKAARKTSRRKGVAHKLDTSCINSSIPVDVANEPFDLIPPSKSPQTVSVSTGYQLASPESSPRSLVYGNTGEMSVGLPACLLTTEMVEVNAIGEERNASFSRLERQFGVPNVVTGSRDNEKADEDAEVSGCRMLDRVDGGDAGEECHHCGFVFKHPVMFDIHMGFHKFDDPWRCNRCGERCADRVDFNRHIATAPHLGQV